MKKLENVKNENVKNENVIVFGKEFKNKLNDDELFNVVNDLFNEFDGKKNKIIGVLCKYVIVFKKLNMIDLSDNEIADLICLIYDNNNVVCNCSYKCVADYRKSLKDVNIKESLKFGKVIKYNVNRFNKFRIS